MIYAIHFGTLPSWLTLLALLVGVIVFYRGGGGEALRSLREANEVLASTVGTQRDKLESAEKTIAELKGRTDVSIALVAALAPINEWAINHELRASERHERTMVLLDMMARNMGRENG